jgi:hypothetical protein
MQKTTRRTFLKRGCLAAGTTAFAAASCARVLGANDDLRVAVVGFHGQGSVHLGCLRKLPGIRLTALCDADRAVLDRGLKAAKDAHESVRGYSDVRKLLEDKNIDALTTATPDHWHALVTIWACQAGKDVYVEKPLCHNLWEGRKMVEAARKYNHIVQFGDQEHGYHTGPMQLEIAGHGKILVAHASLERLRQSIGKVTAPQPVPPSLDYDLWSGPAPLAPLMRKNLHYDWHWVPQSVRGPRERVSFHPNPCSRRRQGDLGTQSFQNCRLKNQSLKTPSGQHDFPQEGLRPHTSPFQKYTESVISSTWTDIMWHSIPRLHAHRTQAAVARGAASRCRGIRHPRQNGRFFDRAAHRDCHAPTRRRHCRAAFR